MPDNIVRNALQLDTLIYHANGAATEAAADDLALELPGTLSCADGMIEVFDVVDEYVGRERRAATPYYAILYKGRFFFPDVENPDKGDSNQVFMVTVTPIADQLAAKSARVARQAQQATAAANAAAQLAAAIVAPQPVIALIAPVLQAAPGVIQPAPAFTLFPSPLNIGAFPRVPTYQHPTRAYPPNTVKLGIQFDLPPAQRLARPQIPVHTIGGPRVLNMWKPADNPDLAQLVRLAQEQMGRRVAHKDFCALVEALNRRRRAVDPSYVNRAWHTAHSHFIRQKGYDAWIDQVMP